MIGLLIGKFIIKNLTFVSYNRLSINVSNYGSSFEYFCFDLINILTYLPIFGNSNIWIFINWNTFSALWGESISSSTSVNRSTLKIFASFLTIAFFWFFWTRFIGQASIVRHTTSLFNPSKSSKGISSVARTSRSAI